MLPRKFSESIKNMNGVVVNFIKKDNTPPNFYLVSESVNKWVLHFQFFKTAKLNVIFFSWKKKQLFRVCTSIQRLRASGLKRSALCSNPRAQSGLLFSSNSHLAADSHSSGGIAWWMSPTKKNWIYCMENWTFFKETNSKCKKKSA